MVIMKGGIKMEHGAGGEGMRELLKLNFNGGGRGNDRVKIEVEVPLEALDDSAVVDNLVVFTTDSHTVTVLPRWGYWNPGNCRHG